MAITSINLGKIKFNWKGAWALGVAYVKDDVVRYSGSSYVCVTGHTSATSWATNSSKFELMAEGTTPTTTKGDLIFRDTSADNRLGIGASGQVLTVEGGVPIWKDNGVNDKIYYVSPDGSDSYSGQSWGTAFATIKHACSVAVGPATVRVASGTYYEALPITVPSFVAVVGDNQRTTIVSPNSGYEQATMWKLGDGALLNKMLFIGLTGYIPYAPDDQNITLATIGGVYVAFNSAVPIATKSPYIIECTAKSASGVGALLDGSLHASGNKSMVFHGYTVILDNGVGYWVKDNAKSEIVSCFTYFCHVGYASTGGGKIRALNGNNSYGTYGVLASGYNLGESTLNGSLYGNQLEYTAVSLTGGSFTAGETITGSLSAATGVIQNVQAGVNKLYYKIVTGGPFLAGETINNGAGVTAVIATGGVTGQKGFVLVVTGLVAEPKPGASIEFTSGDTFTYVVQSVSGWINSSSKAIIVLAGEKVTASLDGANIRIRYDYSNIRLTGHDFLSIGTGGVVSTNYPGTPLQAAAQGSEVIELFPARVFYVSTDQDGNFRVGEYFKVDQATGRATLNASAFDLSGLTSLKLGSIGAQLGELVNEFSSDETLSGNSNTAVPTEKATKQYFTKVSSNIVPSADDLYTLGTPTKKWNHLYVGDGSITIGTVTLSDNAGKLEVKVGASVAPTSINSINNGTSNVSVSNNGNVTITSAGTLGLTINGAGDATFAGNVTINGGATTLSSTEIKIEDAMLQMADGNPANILDIGLFGHYTLASTLYHTGIVRDATDNIWKLFSGVTANPSTTVDFTSATYDALRIGALTTTGVTSSGAIAVNTTSGITTNQTTFPLVNATATTVNFAGAATTIAIGASSGTLTIGNATITGTNATALNLNGASPGIVTSSTGTAAVFNTNALTGNLFGAATTIAIGASSGTITLGNATLTGTNLATYNMDGANPSIVTTSTGTASVFTTNALTGSLFGSATTVTIGATSGTATIRNATVNLSNASAALQINGSPVLSGTTLGSGVTASSLTSFGTSPTVTGTLTAATISASGTISSSAATGFSTTISGGTALRIYGSATATHQWDMYLNGTNLRFSDNTGAGSLVVDTALSSGAITTSGTLTFNGVGSTGGSQLIQDGGYFNAGTLQSGGGPFIGYGVKANTAVANSYVSNTTAGVARAALDLSPGGSGAIRFFTGSATETTAIGSALVSMTNTMTLSGAGALSVTGNTTIGNATASTNVSLFLNGVASKAQRIVFQESGVEKWLIGQGAASETSAFEIYNSTGTTVLSVNKSTSVSTFGAKVIAPSMIAGDNTTSSGALVVGSANSYAGGLVLGKPGTYSGYISATDNLYIRSYAGSGAGSGNVIIENATGTAQFTMNSSTGVLTTVGGFVESSSIALKENINPITGALDAIMSLVGVTYDRRDGSKKNESGLIAEAVDAVLPSLVSKDADGRAEGIYYSKLTAYLVEAIKDLKSQIDPLKEEIKKLKGE